MCVYIYIHIRTYIHTYIHICTEATTNERGRTRAAWCWWCTKGRPRRPRFVRGLLPSCYTYIYIYIYIYIYTFTYIHTHTHIYIYIHTHIYDCGGHDRRRAHSSVIVYLSRENVIINMQSIAYVIIDVCIHMHNHKAITWSSLIRYGTMRCDEPTPCGGEVIHICWKMSRTKHPM